MSAAPQMPWDKYGAPSTPAKAPWENYGGTPDKTTPTPQDQSIPARFMRGAGEGVMQFGQMIAHPLDTLTAMSPHNETVTPGSGFQHSIWTPEGRQERVDQLKTALVIGPMMGGDFARGFGQAVPGAALALATHKAPQMIESPMGQAIGAGVKAGARDVGVGAAKLGGAAAAEGMGIPGPLKYALELPAGFSGGRDIWRGLKKGFQAGRADFNDPRFEAPAMPMDEPRPANMPSVAEEIANHPDWANIVKKPMGGKPVIPPSGAQPVPQPVPITKKLLGAGPIRTPPPADTSGVIKGWQPTILKRQSPRAAGPVAMDLDVTPESGPRIAPSNPQMINRPIMPSSGATPIRPESLQVHIPTELPKAEPFAPNVHKSPTVVARQLEGMGTMAEGQPPAGKPPTSAFTNESIPADRRIKALGIAEQLKKLQGGE